METTRTTHVLDGIFFTAEIAIFHTMIDIIINHIVFQQNNVLTTKITTSYRQRRRFPLSTARIGNYRLHVKILH